MWFLLAPSFFHSFIFYALLFPLSFVYRYYFEAQRNMYTYLSAGFIDNSLENSYCLFSVNSSVDEYANLSAYFISIFSLVRTYHLKWSLKRIFFKTKVEVIFQLSMLYFYNEQVEHNFLRRQTSPNMVWLINSSTDCEKRNILIELFSYLFYF